MIMAATAGIAVANVYYSQPILHAIGEQFHITAEKAGTISVLSQIGYGLGLFFLTPIGDMIERKKLILYLQIGLILSLVLVAFSPTLTILYTGSLLIGVFSVVAQVILPMAASLVKENRGKIVGQIFTGILVGILVARVYSGFITGWLGWHYVYLISAGMVLFTTILMQVDFPSTTERFTGTYGGLLKSTLNQLRRFPVLRRSALTGMLAFGTLSAFWVTLTFYLSDAPFRYTASHIGLFGLLAAAGALIAPVFGKLADNGNTRSSLLMTVGMIICSLILLKVFPLSVIVMVIAIFVLDIGVQATQITNFAKIYSLDENSHSRLNTIYMTTYFIGGGIGTFFGLLCWKHGGWELSTWQMLAWSFIALAITFFSKK